MGITIDLGLPFSLTAVAASMVGSHDCGYVVVLEKRLCGICFEVQLSSVVEGDVEKDGVTL